MDFLEKFRYRFSRVQFKKNRPHIEIEKFKNSIIKSRFFNCPNTKPFDILKKINDTKTGNEVKFT